LPYLFEDYALDTDRRELRRGGSLVPVEPQVFDLLEYLIRNRERVVSRDDLVASVWQGRIVSESALSTRINALRVAIGDSGEAQRLVKTLPRKGIRFVGVVHERQKPQAAAAPATGAEQAALTLPDKPSIAVLPFANMDRDPEQEYFADGVAEEIVTALSRCNWLFVIARNSSFTYKGKAVDVRRVGRELGVRYVLEGSVRRSGNRLRFISQLIDATTGAHIWADRFEGEMSDVFDLQDRITESVVAVIEPNLQRVEIERVKRKPVSNLDAYDLMLRAQQLEYEFTEQSLAEALRCLEQALALDPNYAAAMALAANCYGERAFQGWTQDAAAEATKGLHLATRALALGREDSNVLWMAAHATLRLAMDRERAKELAYGSLALNSNSAIAMTVAGLTEAMSGNPGKAIELLLRAQRLSPRDPRGWLTASALSLAYFTEREFEKAASSAERALMQNARFGPPLQVLAASLANLGKREKAATLIEELLKNEPQLSLSRLRSRLMFMDERVWDGFSKGLLLAGLPE
jgi:TolB-like protein/tetratricopeptide (TPR) repeat protein